MRRYLFIIMVILSFVLFSNCNRKGRIEPVSTEYAPDDVIRGSFINEEGKTLDYLFDNSSNTAVLNLEGEIIELQQVITASGIRYSNDDCQYIEHHGVIELIRDGDIIFRHRKYDQALP